jgi:extradiol dioxygenase family protein
MAKLTPFHVAIPVHDVALARTFYRDVIGCAEGRSDEKWVDFNFFGHQFVIHYKPKDPSAKSASNPVDGHEVPVPHYGLILEWHDWEALRDRLIAHGMRFVIEPHIRFEGKVGEQATMFFNDPCGNALEFKSFKDFDQIFAT